MENIDKDTTNNIKNNNVSVAGTDLFNDSEDFLNELTNDELTQIAGGGFFDVLEPSHISLLLCGGGLPGNV